MAIDNNTKIDRSFKFSLGKTFTSTQKTIDNEDAPSGFILGASSIFSQDAAIPTIAPGASTSILTFYGDGVSVDRFRMIEDISSPLNTAWYASTDGSTLTTMRNTRTPNWVPPIFGNYTIRIFLTKTTSTSVAYLQEIFFSDITSPVFDYKAGILTFESDPLAAYTGIVGGPPDGIQISGYVYSGPLLSEVFDANGNFTGGLSDLLGTAQATFIDPYQTLFISSPGGIGTAGVSWTTESTPLGAASPEWHGIFTLPNGRIIVVGGNSGNTTPYLAYSYGDTHWYAGKLFDTSNIHRLNAAWGDSDFSVYAVGFGAGSSSALLKSINGGLDWEKLTSPSTSTINGIWGTASTNLYIVGDAGTIKHSTNGTTFSSETNADSNNLYGIWGSSSSNIFAVGATGTIRHSTGSGTWTGQTSGTSNILRGVFGFSSSSVYAVGDSGTVLHYNGSSWSAESGLPGTFYATGVWGINIGGAKKIYIAGNTNSGSGPGAIYFSNGAGTWTLNHTLSGSLAYCISGGSVNGAYVGSNNNSIEVLHQNPVVNIEGNLVTFGYITSGLSILAQNLTATKTLNLLGGSSTAININISKEGTNASTASFLPTALSIFSTDAGATTDYTVLTASSADTGEGFRLWREAPDTYTLDLGSKITTGNDGVTPYAGGGRIRLGGFTTSPLTTARAEIETVSTAGLNISAYQGDMTLLNSFGVAGVTKGDINLSTTNGAIVIGAGGNESPSQAGEIRMYPGHYALIQLSTNTTSTFVTIAGSGGSFIRFSGDGSINNGAGTLSTGAITSTTLNAGSGLITTTGTISATGGSGIISAGLKVLSGGYMEANTYIYGHSQLITDGSISGASISVSGTANSGGITTGVITATGSITSSQNVRAAGFLNQVRMGVEFSAAMSNNHFGIHFNPNATYGYCSAWGMGLNPCGVAGTVYETMSCFGARLVGVSGATVSTDHSTLVGGGFAPGQTPIVLGSFYNEVGAVVRWQTGGAMTGFSVFGFLFVI